MTNLSAILAVLFLAAMFPCRSEAGWIPFSPGRAHFLSSSSSSSSSSLAIHQRNKSDPAGKEVNDRDVLRSICFIRGGNVHFDSEGDEDDEEEEEEEEEEADFEDEEEVEADSEAEDETEEEKEHDEENDSEMENSTPPSSSVVAGPPVKLTISTNLLPSSGTSLLDQTLEFTASRKRTILGIKQAISKTMAGRPYSGCSADESEGGLLGKCLVLRHRGRVLEDDESIEDVVAGAGLDEEDEDEDDEEEEDEDEDDDVIRLKFALDILPPVDAKFGIELMEKAKMLSTKDLMEAYCTNMAGMIYGQELMRKELENLERVEKRLEGDGERGGDFHGEEEDEEEEDKDDAENDRNPNHSLNIRKAAALIKKQMLNSLSPEALRLMEEEHDRVQQFLMNEAGDATTMTREQSANSVFGLIPKDSAERRHRGGGWDGGSRGRALKGGAAMNVKRALQRNMNVNWADTTRNSLLFLFFGYFGGRNSFSRTFLLLSSPLCFVLQTRPVKVALKQLFYTIGEPPGILLSLLPAPQQAIMSLDYGRVMRELYGEKALEGEEWMTMELKDRMMRVGVGGEEDEYDIDEDLEEYDDEADYDFDQDED